MYTHLGSYQQRQDREHITPKFLCAPLSNPSLLPLLVPPSQDLLICYHRRLVSIFQCFIEMYHTLLLFLEWGVFLAAVRIIRGFFHVAAFVSNSSLFIDE